MTIAEATAIAIEQDAVAVLVGKSSYTSVAAAAAANTRSPTANPSKTPTASPTLSCPVHFAARADRRSGTVGDIRSDHDEQACADLCWQNRPYSAGVDTGYSASSGYGCVAFTTSPGNISTLGYTPTNCALVNGDAQSADTAVPCEEGRNAAACFCAAATARPDMATTAPASTGASAGSPLSKITSSAPTVAPSMPARSIWAAVRAT